MNKKMTIAGVVVLAMALGAFARPHGPGFRPCGPGPGPGFYHGPRYHGGFWGRGGCNFWPGFVGGVVGCALYDAVTYPRYASSVVVTPAPAPVVVQQQPVVVQQPAVQSSVWVEGRYVDQVQANGTVIRVWQPGHYVQSTAVVQ